MANEHTKHCSVLLAIRKMQIKATWRGWDDDSICIKICVQSPPPPIKLGQACGEMKTCSVLGLASLA